MSLCLQASTRYDMSIYVYMGTAAEGTAGYRSSDLPNYDVARREQSSNSRTVGPRGDIEQIKIGMIRDSGENKRRQRRDNDAGGDGM